MISGIIEILKEDTGVSSVTGLDTNTKTKVYPVRLPQSEEKTIVPAKYLVIYKTQGNPAQGKGCTDPFQQMNFNVHCCADQYPDVDALMVAVVEALGNLAGVETGSGANHYRFNSIWYVSDYDTFDENARRFVRVVSFGCNGEKL